MRYLLVGYGNIGLKRRAVLGAACVATVDPFNPAADFRDPDGCAPDRYDAVILATPNQVKLKLLERFLSLGKHVLVEKPLLFPDRPTAERLDEIARGRGAVWYTSYNFRFEPGVLALRRHLEAGTIGRLYHGRLHYANGTVGDVVRSWRDEGFGVLEDLGCHLLDFLDFLLGYRGPMQAWALERYEAKCFDRCLVATADGRFVLDVSFLSWKNRLSLEFFGERGSLHLEGFSKWGPTELIVRERILPSGVPRERRERFDGPDPTWRLDLEHFERVAREGRTSMEKDWWITRTLHALAPGVA